MTSAAEQPLVKDPEAVLATLRRMRNTNGAVSFWNADHSIRFMLRNDAEAYELDDIDPDAVHADLCIVVDEDDSLIAKVLELEHDGYFDEPTMFVLESYEVAGDAGPVVEKLNEVHKYKVCPCARYLIKDQADICLFCQLTAAPGACDKQFCPICHDDGIKAHMTTQACCDQPLHLACLATWRDQGKSTCPLCRA